MIVQSSTLLHDIFVIIIEGYGGLIMNELYTSITQWPIIIQGTLGSALFWAILKVLTYLFSYIQSSIKKQKSQSKNEKLLKEYIYKKYTSNSGLAYYLQGYLLTFDHVLRFFMMGMLFFSVSLLAGGITKLSLSIGLVGAIIYFFKSLAWLIPDETWHSEPTSERWKRIAKIEETLWGKAEDDTLGWISKFEEKE